jgi:hypothetical protein
MTTMKEAEKYTRKKWGLITPFSRRRALAYHECDQIIKNREWAVPEIFKHIVGILTLTSKAFRKIIRASLNGAGDKEDFFLEVDVTTNRVRTRSLERDKLVPTVLQHHIAFAEICEPDLLSELDDSFYSTPGQHTDITLACLRFHLRDYMIRGYQDFNNLLHTISKMNEIVHISSRIQARSIPGSIPPPPQRMEETEDHRLQFLPSLPSVLLEHGNTPPPRR